MSTRPKNAQAESFARHLLTQAAWPTLPVLLLGLCGLIAPHVEPTVPLGTVALVLMLLAIAAGIATLALSAHLAFDALLFRLVASHADETAGLAAVDDTLARMRLRPAPDRARPLAERMAGTRRLLWRQRLAFALFALAAGTLLCGGAAMSGASRILSSMMRNAASVTLSALAWAVTGVRPIWSGSQPSDRQRIYFANHASHGDFILLSACLGAAERGRTRAVAAADYWGKTKLRRFIAEDLLSSVLIHRNWTEPGQNPIAIMLSVLDQGNSLIIFPEGTRNMTDAPLLPFRSGIYNLAVARPDVELIPCWLENISRVLPKGHFLPVPLLCRVVFGAPVTVLPGEERRAFLDRAHATLLALNPRPPRPKP